VNQLYPTVSAPPIFAYGLAAFDIRDDQLYPTVSAPPIFAYGLAAFDIR
jgi:hypothetical protein